MAISSFFKRLAFCPRNYSRFCSFLAVLFFIAVSSVFSNSVLAADFSVDRLRFESGAIPGGSFVGSIPQAAQLIYDNNLKRDRDICPMTYSVGSRRMSVHYGGGAAGCRADTSVSFRCVDGDFDLPSRSCRISCDTDTIAGGQYSGVSGPGIYNVNACAYSCATNHDLLTGDTSLYKAQECTGLGLDS